MIRYTMLETQISEGHHTSCHFCFDKFDKIKSLLINLGDFLKKIKPIKSIPTLFNSEMLDGLFKPQTLTFIFDFRYKI